MKTFLWNRRFETGLASVDEQHRKLVALINRLGESSLAGELAGEEPLKELFSQLTEYANLHFADEERLMREAHVDPAYVARHQDVHAQFAAQLSSLWKSRKMMRDAGEILFGFLVAWLGFHILGEDLAMARQIAAIRAGASPSAALAQADERHGQDASTAALIDALQELYHTLLLQNRELGNANQRLEERVAERTRALSDANAALGDAYSRMEGLARVDGLLGIANRRHFDERFNEEWLRARRERAPIALLMIDVDHFKRYNDAYGHLAGDDCLRVVVQRVASASGTRPGDLLARFGGEELVMMLTNTSAEGGTKIARDVCASVAEAHLPHGASPVAGHVTVSVGVACCVPPASDGMALLIAAADRALYVAKEQGRNRVAVDPQG